jgi:RNA polymerase sigma-70 factor (ECF subfamily)
MLNWFVGRENYGAFMEWVFQAAGTDWQLKPIGANGQPGFAAYQRIGQTYKLHTVQLFTVTPDGIGRNSVFQDPDVFTCMALPFELGK